MKKVLFHNMTLKGIESVPGVLDFDQRSIILAQNDDVVVSRVPFEEDFLEYLSTFGINHQKIYFVSHNGKKWNSAYKSTELVQKLRKFKGYILDTYHVTNLESVFAKKIGCTLYGNSKISDMYGTKSGFRILCKKIGIPVVSGYEKLRTAPDVLASIESLSQSSNKLLLRLDEGVSGAGNYLVDPKAFLKKRVNVKYDEINKMMCGLPQRLSNSGVTVEKWVDNVRFSPSLQFLVQLNGEIQLLSTHNQILEGKEKWYVGCEYPSSIRFTSHHDSIISDAYKLMSYFCNAGFVGYCGLDLIITDDSYFFVEANMRKPGTTYPREFVRRVYGGLDNLKYVAKDIKDASLVGKEFSFIYSKLKKLMIHDVNQKEGVLIYNTGAMKHGGRFDMVAVSITGKPEEILLEAETRVFEDR